MCRYPGCATLRVHRFGLCNKHRKWVERGFIDQNLQVLKPLPSRPNYKYARCKVEECKERPRRNFFCPRHSRQWREGILSETGARLKPLVRYSKDFGCLKCGKGGKISKGFCKTHYAQLRRGRIDYDGNELSPAKRITRYTSLDFCKVKGCSRKPREKGFCPNHGAAFRRGVYDMMGKRLIEPLHRNRGKTCLECDKPAVTRLLCPVHYYRKYQASRRTFVNKGKECSAPGCKKPAHCKTLCVTHYGRRKARLKQKEKALSLIPAQMPSTPATTTVH